MHRLKCRMQCGVDEIDIRTEASENQIPCAVGRFRGQDEQAQLVRDWLEAVQVLPGRRDGSAKEECQRPGA